MAISETVMILAGGTAVLSIMFGIRLAMRAVAGGGTEAPRSGDGEASAAGGSGAPDVAGVIALPPLIFPLASEPLQRQLAFFSKMQRCSHFTQRNDRAASALNSLNGTVPPFNTPRRGNRVHCVAINP